MCAKHYDRWTRANKRPCSIDGCTATSLARGYCSKHYNEWRATQNGPCSFEGCDRGALVKGYCEMHYRRTVDNGDPGKVQKRAANPIVVTADGKRICVTCQVPKQPAEFHKDNSNSDGYRNECKTCVLKRERNRYANDSDRYRELRRQQRAQDIERFRAVDMARYHRNRDKRIALATAAFHKRRALMLTIETDKGITVPALRKIHGDQCCYCKTTMVFKSQPAALGIKPERATIEHILPLSRGGTHTFDNVTLACHSCNVRKNSKTVDEWAGSATTG